MDFQLKSVMMIQDGLGATDLDLLSLRKIRTKLVSDHMGYFPCLHAFFLFLARSGACEVNAIMFRNCVDLEGCTLYTTLFPCHECAKAIFWSGIKEIYYLTDYRSLPGSFEWDDPDVDDNWVENKDKPTYVASRYLLQKFYTSGKHQKVELMNGR